MRHEQHYSHWLELVDDIQSSHRKYGLQILSLCVAEAGRRNSRVV